MSAFKPYKCAALAVSASTTHDTSALVFPSVRAATCQVYARNQGAVDVWVKFGPTTATEAVGGSDGTIVPAYGFAVLNLDGSDIYVSSETEGSSGTIVFVTGEVR